MGAWGLFDCLVMPVVVGLLLAGLIGYFWTHRGVGRRPPRGRSSAP